MGWADRRTILCDSTTLASGGVPRLFGHIGCGGRGISGSFGYQGNRDQPGDTRTRMRPSRCASATKGGEASILSTSQGSADSFEPQSGARLGVTTGRISSDRSDQAGAGLHVDQLDHDVAVTTSWLARAPHAAGRGHIGNCVCDRSGRVDRPLRTLAPAELAPARRPREGQRALRWGRGTRPPHDDRRRRGRVQHIHDGCLPVARAQPAHRRRDRLGGARDLLGLLGRASCSACGSSPVGSRDGRRRTSRTRSSSAPATSAS